MSATSEESGLSLRLLRALETLARAHAEHAKKEAERDLSRIISGAILLAIALLLAGAAFVGLQLGAVFALHEFARLAWTYAALIVAGANTSIALIVFLLGRARVSRPVMTETRRTLKQAMVVLRG